MQYNYMIQTKVKPLKYCKIPRHKVPNLVNLIENNNKTNAALPKFFNKIQNSLKLLEDPIVSNDSSKLKNQQVKYNKNTLSLRIKELAKHKQRFTTLNNSQHNQSLYCPSIGDQSQLLEKRRPVSLPRVQNGQYKPKSYNFQARATSYTLSPINKHKHLNKYIDEEKNVQQIASSNINQKSYDQIIQQLQYQEQLKRKLQKQKHQLDYQNECQNQNYDFQTNNAIKMDSKKYQKQNELPNYASQNLTQISEKIIGNQPKLYDDYDKRLMQKIKVYKSKRFKFSLRVVWKH